MKITDTSTLCSNTTSIFVEVLPKLEEPQLECKIFIPNVFTPNNDGSNDILQVFANNCFEQVKTFEFAIFNRFGERIYTIAGNDFSTVNCEGYYKNEKANIGVYVYYLLVNFEDETQEIFKGNVSLLR